MTLSCVVQLCSCIGARLPRPATGGCCVIHTVATKKFSQVQLQTLNRFVVKVVDGCVNNQCNYSAEGPTEYEWEILRFSCSATFGLNRA